jgi:hypothetical protein
VSLARLETTFWEYVRDDRPPERATEFVDRAPLGAARRLGVYHHAYFERQRAVLGELFPRLRAALGDASFFRVATEYVKRWPSSTPIIERIGANFPEFLRDCAEFETAAVDLSRLEWARVEALLAADAPGAVSLADLARLDARVIRLVPSPSTRLLLVAPEALQLWRDATWNGADGSPEFVLVVRADDAVRQLALSKSAGKALARTLEGESLARAFAEFSGAEAVTLARDALATFVELGVWSSWEAQHEER